MMGPRKILKIDQGQGITNCNIKQWCDQPNIQIEMTTGNIGIADFERLHKTFNLKNSE